jgi:GNAT superfamily N-acetyltransferase
LGKSADTIGLKILLRRTIFGRDETPSEVRRGFLMNEPQVPHVEIRRMWPPDKEAFRDHLVRLDLRSRHERFGGGMSDDVLIRYAENCFGKGDLIYGAFVGGSLVGAGELRSNRAIWSEQAPFGRHISAEAAFSVEPAHRRRGIGEMLFKRILRAAANHGVETIEIVCLPDNVGMRRLAQKFKTQFSFEEDALTGRLKARPPTAFSLMREATADIADFGASLFDAHWRAVAEARAGRS